MFRMDDEAVRDRHQRPENQNENQTGFS